MRQRLNQSIECSREEQLRHDGRCGGMLDVVSMSVIWAERRLTQWLFLQNQEDSIKQLEKFGEIVKLIVVSTERLQLMTWNLRSKE